MLAEEVCRHLPSKDTVSEALAIYNLMLDRTRYMRDPRTIELVKAPWVVVQQMMAGHTPGLDCFLEGTLLQRMDQNPVSSGPGMRVPIERIEPGQYVWGYKSWSRVVAVVPRGIRSVDQFILECRPDEDPNEADNCFNVTPEHQLYLASGERILASQAEPGMELLHPNGRPRRISLVARGIMESPVWDIQTDDHYVYLPEADVTVSNCDDLSATICAMLAITGAECRVATVAFKDMFYQGRRQYSHVFAQAKEPRTGSWITLDPVAGNKTEEMKRRVVAAKFWPVM